MPRNLFCNEAASAGSLQAAAKADRLIARAGGNADTPHRAFAVDLGLDDVRLRPPITPAYLREMSFSDLFAPSSFGDDDTCTDQAPAAGAAAGFSSAAGKAAIFSGACAAGLLGLVAPVVICSVLDLRLSRIRCESRRLLRGWLDCGFLARHQRAIRFHNHRTHFRGATAIVSTLPFPVRASVRPDPHPWQQRQHRRLPPH
jgi:hypothetical protein